MQTETIKLDGNYLINNKHKNARSAVYASGDFSTATANLEYRNSDGSYTSFIDGSIYSGDQLQVDHGIGVELYVTVSGSDASTHIEIKCAGVD